MKLLTITLGAVLALGSPGLLAPGAAESTLQGEPESFAVEPESELERLRRQTEEAKERKRTADAARGRASSSIDDLRLVPTLPVPEPDREVVPAPAVAELEASVNRAQGLLRAARETAANLESKANSRAERLTQIPGEIERLSVSIEARVEERNGLALSPENEEERALFEATIARDRAEIQALEAEASMFEAESALIQLRQDRAQARVSAAERAAELWTAWFDQERQAAGDDAVLEFGRRLDDLVGRFPVLENSAEPERDHLKELVGEKSYIKQIAAAKKEVDRLGRTRREIERRMESSRQRLGLGGLTEGMAANLQRDHKWLSTPRELKAASRARNQRLSAVELMKLDLEDRRDELVDLEVAAAELLQSLKLEEPVTEPLREAAVELLRDGRAVSEIVRSQLTELHGEYLRQKAIAVHLSLSALEYRGIIEEHILWAAGMKPLSLAELARLPEDFMKGARDHSFRAAGDRWVAAAQHSPLRAALIAAILMGLIAVRRMLKARREELGRLVRSYRTDKFWYTVRALIQTALLSAPGPLMLAGTAWLLSVMGASNPETQKAALAPLTPDPALAPLYSSLFDVAAIWFLLQFVRGVAHEKGVGGQHFRWPGAVMALLRREIRWFLPVAVTFGFVTLYLDRLREPEWTNSLGRIAFVIWMVGLTAFLRRLLRPASALWSGDATEDRGLFWRSRGAWGLMLVLAPLVLVGLSLAGYDYTALQFEKRLRLSFAAALALMFGHALLLRWLFITRRRLAVSQALDAKARRERRAKKRNEVSEAGVPAVDVDTVDIPAVDAQTRQLFKSALTLASFAAFYFIWASTLPALRAFDRVQLYPQMTILENDPSPMEIVAPVETAQPAEASSSGARTGLPIPGALPSTGKGVAASSGQAVASNGIPASLTLADLLLAIIFGILTLVAARNLPALLELTLLQRLPMDGGAKYAVTTIIRYVILLLGVSAISGALGVGWQQIQFLAAALTFGLAFGLQEIFANFVSGLIILIERPVRVGDIVTVGGVEGRVTQLRMRATTILDWDRKESLIPNKQFITGNIVNWTLSDSVTRTVIPVGVAYGSDTDLVRKVLLRVAHESEFVMNDPEPTAIFTRFGDSTLDFNLRVYIENRDIWPAMIDQIHSEIDAAFRKAKIEIAFPQRDIHIRSGVEPRPE